MLKTGIKKRTAFDKKKLSAKYTPNRRHAIYSHNLRRRGLRHCPAGNGI
jgi:hypothetical protein